MSKPAAAGTAGEAKRDHFSGSPQIWDRWRIDHSLKIHDYYSMHFEHCRRADIRSHTSDADRARSRAWLAHDEAPF